MPHPSNNPRHGFALPAVLVMMTGLLVLLTALMIVVDLERKTARVSTEIYRAELAVESGLEEAKGSLAFIGSTDSFVVAEFPMAVAFDDDGDGKLSSLEDDQLEPKLGDVGRPYLYGIQGKRNGRDIEYQMVPLFTTEQVPYSVPMDALGLMQWPETPGLANAVQPGLDPYTAITAVPHKSPPVTNWRIVKNADGEPVARYSYWVEDMQGYLDPNLAPGNPNGRANARWPETNQWNTVYSGAVEKYKQNSGAVPLWPAPGLNPGYQISTLPTLSTHPMLDQIGLFTIPSGNRQAGGTNILGREDDTTFDDQLRGFRQTAPTTRSLMTLMGFQGPLMREISGPNRGRLVMNGKPNELGRSLEENITRGNRSWRERALVPYSPGLAPAVMGQPKLNLNAQLVRSVPRATGVTRIAEQINKGLPDFEQRRKGGFPENYLETLAACVLDYADDDSEVTAEEGRYRGIENTPLVSEYLYRTVYGWELDDGTVETPFYRVGGRLYLKVMVQMYAEFWNMTNHQAEGQFQFSYQYNNYFIQGAAPEQYFSDDGILSNTQFTPGGPSASEHSMTQLDDGYWYFPATSLTLQPNEYRLMKVGTVKYFFDVGPESFFADDSLNIIDASEPSSYRLRWQGAGEKQVLVDRSLGGVAFDLNTDVKIPDKKARVYSHVCANSYDKAGTFSNAAGDLRMSYYAIEPIAYSKYPHNYSPNRRNVRYATIYKNNQSLIYAATLPSRWGDGGHNSDFDFNSFHNDTSSNSNLAPDNPQYMLPVSPPFEAEKSPVFLSNLGRFVSETELASVFDPAMWEEPGDPYNGRPTSAYVDEITKSNRVTPSRTLGGGNTLRIGRPEHERFYKAPPSEKVLRADSRLHAAHLLDLFHAGVPNAVSVQDLNSLRRVVEGHVNINTASRDVLRALVAGYLATDRLISLESSSHDVVGACAPRTMLLEANKRLGSPSLQIEADLIADSIIKGRPYVSPSELALIKQKANSANANEPEVLLLGNPSFHPRGANIQWTDRAAEEVFARLYNSSTVRSRNFRIHVVGQSLKLTPSGTYQIGSTKKKSYRVFVNSGSLGTTEIDTEKVRVEVIHEVNL